MSDDILPPNGLKTAVAEAHSPDASPPDVLDGDQLALLPLHNAGAENGQRNEVGSAGRGAGRPRGSKNKSTEAWTDYLLSRHSSPLQALAELYSRPLDELCRDLLRMAGACEGAKPTWAQLIEVLKIQLGAAKELAPYLHQKQPMAIQGGEHGFINLFIGDMHKGSLNASDATNFDIEILDVESEENQSLSDQENQEFDAEPFDVSDQSSGNAGNINDKPTD